MNKTYAVCQKCGKATEWGTAKKAGWLIEQRIAQPEGYLVIRCLEHITDHARRQAGQRQEYYHEHKSI